jgi:hypothetical protein
MNHPTRNRRTSTAAVFCAATIALFTFFSLRLRAAEAQAAQAPSQLAKDLIGAWELTGTPEKPNEPPEGVRSFKFRSARVWTVTGYNKTTGVVLYHHGGSYTLDGDTYEETVEYSNENNSQIINQKFKYQVKVEGDTFTQIGIGNSFNEVWKRLK